MTITLTREEAQQVLDAFVNWDARGRLRLIELLRARLSAPEPDYRDVVIKGDLWRIEFLPDHAASVVLVRANYEAMKGEERVTKFLTLKEMHEYGKELAQQIAEELEQKPEPVAWLHSFTGYGWQVVPEKLYPTDQPLYTAPAQREWQGLTDEEVGMLTVFDGLHHIEVPLLADFIRAIEAKLKEKNSD